MKKLYIFIILLFLFKSCDFKNNNLDNKITKNNKVYNLSTINNIDKYVYHSLDYLEIDSVSVYLYNIPNIFKVTEDNNDYYIVRGFIIENNENSYNIYLNNDISNNDIILTIAHEMIHLKQYKDNRLEISNFNNGIFFDSIFYFTDFLKYDKRPWEIEAFNEQDELMEILNP